MIIGGDKLRFTVCLPRSVYTKLDTSTCIEDRTIFNNGDFAFIRVIVGGNVIDGSKYIAAFYRKGAFYLYRKNTAKELAYVVTQFRTNTLKLMVLKKEEIVKVHKPAF
ncbi:hypothetical protein [Vibrio sp. 99-70-13A1]|uniref:hypothetical protein n=1 Tax=Vibrio sp. 99-70-13A1 TaxID=2607601 RepID=UPI0014933B91|nr:hypothetical protein [Vibrio sp. 99-70-13A1]NOH98947.1 hypothetical protein [Vibrio sp. 99-70-13A1]